MKINQLEEVEQMIWGEIAQDLEGEQSLDQCLCFNDGFCCYLSAVSLPFPVESYSPGVGWEGTADLFLGWQVLEDQRSLLTTEEIFTSLKPGGEARLFGFYSAPRPEDLREWRGRSSAAGLPPPQAVLLGEISGWLKNSSFERYTLRKRGIYYDCRLQKDA